jgi:lipopolysaccharide export system permease protein
MNRISSPPSMPFRLHRYLFVLVAGASLAGVALFVFVLITGNAMRDIFGLLAEDRIPPTLFFELLWLLLPYAVSFAMPLGLLIGILLVMGRLSANNELTAIRTAGLSLWTVAAPVLAVALLATAVTGWINSYHAPAARASYKAILNDLVRTDPLRFIVPGVFIHDFPGYVLYVEDKDGNRLRHFWLWELDQHNRAVRLLRAEEGGFAYDEERDALLLTLVGGFTELRDPRDPDRFDRPQPLLTFSEARILLPLESILGAAHRPRDIGVLNARDLWQRRQLKMAEARAAADPAVATNARTEALRAQYHFSRNWAMACSAFSLALLGIPLGIRASRSETYANMVMALGLALSYYLAMVLIGWAERTPAVRPDLLVWLPNLFCQALGFALLARANRIAVA